MRLYVAGPMRGYKDFNFPEFHRVTEALRAHGHEVFNPAERDEQKYGAAVCHSQTGSLADVASTGFSLREAMAFDLSWICLHADGIALLDGWSLSSGAKAEVAAGSALGIDHKPWKEWIK